MSTELTALSAVDFQWASELDEVWRKQPFHIQGLQAAAGRELADKLARFGRSASAAPPLGIALLGPTGSGKSHLLGLMRKAAHDRGQFFVLVDMTCVANFEATLALGTLRSLCQPDADGRPQWRGLLDQLFAEYADTTLRADGVDALRGSRPPGLIMRCDRLIEAIAKRHAHDPNLSVDVLRAFLLFSSDHEDVADLGETWLSGIGVSREDAELHGFAHAREQPSSIFRGLMWLLSLVRPTLLALDEIDSIVAEHEVPPPVRSEELPPESRSSTTPPSALGLSAGIARLLDTSWRAQIVVACREETWSVLDRRSPVSLQGRFEAPVVLRPLSDATSLRSLVAMRLQQAYRAASVAPPHPCHPFRDEFFAEMAGTSPRELYKRCDIHRRECLRVQRVVQTGTAFPLASKEELEPIQRRFEALLLEAPIERLLAEEDEPALGRLLANACVALVQYENPTRSDLDVGVDRRWPGRPGHEALHARIRLMLRADADRERHYSFRFVQKAGDRAFQVRLAAAMTAAGIGRSIGHTRLAVLRVGAPPTAVGSERLVTELRSRGGSLLAPSRTDLAALWAIGALREDPAMSQTLPTWLRSRRPVSRISVFAEAVRWLYGESTRPTEVAPHLIHSSAPPGPEGPMRRAPSSTRKRTHPGLGRVDQIPGLGTPSERVGVRAPLSIPAPYASSRPPAARAGRVEPQLPLGERLGDGATRSSVEVPLLSLRNHAMVLAGEGSAKSVLLKRMIEEAVLLGVPAIIIDSAGDLSLLGDERPSAPDGWKIGDERKARLYHERSEVVIWTPGIHRGNPLLLQPLPDLAKLVDDSDELEAALSMVVASLGAIVAPSSGRGPAAAPQVLLGALRLFARRGGGGIGDLIALLGELPAEVGVGIEQASQIARQMSEQLQIECKLNPLLGQGAQLEPKVLLGTATSGRTRVSVINLRGLASERSRQQFVDQLAMTLFSYIKGHPARHRPLLGLLVVDEARDFAPATRSVPGKESLLRLVPQARKYGLGILFATEAPKGVDPQLIAGCATHFYGRVSSPAAIETVREHLRRRGGSGNDVATLMPNVFYAHTEGMSSPVRVAPLPCLSAHAATPPGELEIIARAQRSRAQALHV